LKKKEINNIRACQDRPLHDSPNAKGATWKKELKTLGTNYSYLTARYEWAKRQPKELLN